MLLKFLVAGVFLKLFFVDINFWHFGFDGLAYAGPYSIEDATMRLLDFVPVVAFLGYVAFISPERVVGEFAPHNESRNGPQILNHQLS